jgi:hypothetical protein
VVKQSRTQTRAPEWVGREAEAEGQSDRDWTARSPPSSRPSDRSTPAPWALRRAASGPWPGRSRCSFSSDRLPEFESIPPAQRSESQTSAGRAENKSRVGKGRPAASSESRVSPSPSKIPYGGFSPVRLQMDRQWRLSMTSQGLSAVHVPPTSSSYTPPQLQLPGIHDPRRDYPF